MDELGTTPRGEPGGERSTLEDLHAALLYEHFPIGKDELYYGLGSLWLQRDDGSRVEVRELLDQMSRARFESPRQVIDHLARALAQPRARS